MKSPGNLAVKEPTWWFGTFLQRHRGAARQTQTGAPCLHQASNTVSFNRQKPEESVNELPESGVWFAALG